MQVMYYWVKFLIGSCERSEIEPCIDFFLYRTGFDNCPINASLIRCSEANVVILVLLCSSVHGLKTAVLWDMTPCNPIET